MEKFSESCDIIRAVSGSHVDAPHLLEKILEYLDFEDLLTIEKVSEDWKNILVKSHAWRTLLSWNISHCPNWTIAATFIGCLSHEETHFETLCREKCLTISSVLKDLDQEIRAGFKIPSKFSLMFPRTDERVNSHSLYSFTDVYWLNAEYIGRGCIDGTIVLWERWPKQLKGVYKPGPVNIQQPTSLQFSKDVVVAGYDDGFVHAWNIHTQESIFTFYDNELQGMGYLATSYDVALGSAPKSNWLLTCTLAHGEACSQLVLTSWQIDSCRPCITQSEKVFLDEELAALDRFFVDGNRAILILTTVYDETEVQIRSTQTLVVFKTVTLPVRFVDDVNLERGLLLEGSSNPIRLWDIESGKCLCSYQTETSSASCRFLSRDFVAAIDYHGSLSFWEIPKNAEILDSNHYRKSSPLWSLATGIVARRRRYKILLGGDMFQIIILVHGSSFPSPHSRTELPAESYVMQVMETRHTSLDRD